MKDTDQILKAVTGNLKGEARKRAIASLDEDPEIKEEYAKIKNAWALFSATKPMPEYQVEDLYLNFRKQLSTEYNRSRSVLFPHWLKYAAVFLLLAGVFSVFFYLRSDRTIPGKSSTKYTSVIADNGQISKVILPDSSVVWLNSGTKITYNSGFAIGNRDIDLVGQAFFAVRKNEELPLKVFCNNLEVKVTGTRFDVSAYSEDKNISVVLESGKVELSDSKVKSFRYDMKAGEMVLYDTLSKKIDVKDVDTQNFTSWKEGVLIFRDDPMDQVIGKLKRRYDIDIEVVNPDIYKSLFTATIKNETLEEIFKSVSFACSVHYQIIRDKNMKARTKVILSD
jgi:ferric-dicitrate binding protein FerR (iron transport regulator)